MNKPNIFKAGAAQVDITPSLGSFVGVDFLTHYARYIHDPLHSKALIFSDNSKMVAIIVVDICIMPTDFMDNVKTLISNKTGIERSNILLSSTHTHAAGAIIDLLSCSPDLAYIKRLPDLILKSVQDAINNLQAAKIASTAIDVPQHVLCRRYILADGGNMPNPVTGKQDTVKTNPFGQEHLIIGQSASPDPSLALLAIKNSETDAWISVLGNYSLHYVGDWHVDSISADYFGEFSKQIKSLLSANEDFVGIMSNGTSGDINIWDFKNPDRYPKGDLEKTKIIGGDLATAALKALENLNWELNPKLNVKYKELEIAVNKPSADEIEKATQIVLETESYNNLGLDVESMVKIYAREQVLLAQYPDKSTSAIQAIKLGNLTIGALGGEFFAETGLKLKEKAKGNYFTITLANTYDGYVLPAHEIAKGGYESWRARSSYLEADAEQTIRENLEKLIHEL